MTTESGRWNRTLTRQRTPAMIALALCEVARRLAKLRESCPFELSTNLRRTIDAYREGTGDQAIACSLSRSNKVSLQVLEK